MDLKKMDFKAVKTAYIAVAAVLAVCAIVSAYLHHQYIALGFIVLASAAILAGSLYVSYLMKRKQLEDVD